MRTENASPVSRSPSTKFLIHTLSSDVKLCESSDDSFEDAAAVKKPEPLPIPFLDVQSLLAHIIAIRRFVTPFIRLLKPNPTYSRALEFRVPSSTLTALDFSIPRTLPLFFVPGVFLYFSDHTTLIRTTFFGGPNGCVDQESSPFEKHSALVQLIKSCECAYYACATSEQKFTCLECLEEGIMSQ